MIRQVFRLSKYDWLVEVYYDSTCQSFQYLAERLKRLGCKNQDLREAYENLTSCKKNTGITYSNFVKRKTIMILARTISSAEFANTYEHERGHLEMHIVQSFGIDMFSEEQCYLRGAIAQKMHPVARYFLCE